MSDIYQEDLRIARKPVNGGCLFCGLEIPAGERYADVSVLDNGAWWHCGLHEQCSEICGDLYRSPDYEDMSFEHVFDGARENGSIEKVEGRWRMVDPIEEPNQEPYCYDYRND